MSNPFQGLKYLPWVTLSQVAGLDLGFFVLLDFSLNRLVVESAIARSILSPFLSDPLALVVTLGISGAMGALGVYLMERLYPQIVIQKSTLWALVFCLFVGLAIRTVVPLPGIFVALSYTHLVGVVLGTFFKGRPYWY